MPAISWDSKLANAIGDKTAKALGEAFGHRIVGDLLMHYPRTWIPRGSTSTLVDLVDGEHTTLACRITSSKVHPYQDRRTGEQAFRVEALVAVGDGQLSLTFFDRRKHIADWRQAKLSVNREALFEGRATWDRFNKRWQLVHPNSDIFDKFAPGGDGKPVAQEMAELSELRPIYPATKKISSWKIESAVKILLELLDDVPEMLPAPVRTAHRLLPARVAYQKIHRPNTRDEHENAAETFRFQEAFVTQTVLAQRRAELRKLPAKPRAGVTGGLLDRFDQRLPFALTGGQRDVCEEILGDLATGHPMHRLLQGEVGSGKTVVALRAMLRVIDSGGQAALLAPTEVLAQQHHRSITAMLGDMAAGGMLDGAEDGTRVALLTGSSVTSARKSAMLDAVSGVAGIVVGTHALLEDKVKFFDLGLVVIDEQHRFGVEQRAALTAKSGESPPHVLVMTATPIPRTVAMTVFGDLETSTLAELPAGRAPIQTNVVPMAENPSWVDRAWSRIREESNSGHQSYVVCPRIGDDDPAVKTKAPSTEEMVGAPDDEEETRAQAAAVQEIAPLLRNVKLRGLRVEALHGRLAPGPKDEVMRAFTTGEVDVLVSTTVIEVGVDVANATMIVILDADRFGVSQLHQLRGRVGRGGLPGLCLLVTRSRRGSPSFERLEAVAATTDGFALSRLDLAQRREGDVLGVSQSGKRSSLRLLSVLDHEELILEARESATLLLKDDPDLASHPALAHAVHVLNDSDRAAFIEKV